MPALGTGGGALAQDCENNVAPTADAGPDQAGVVDSPVTLDGTGSFDPDGTVVEYWWRFGDDQSTGWQPDPVVQHVYADPGTYTAKLWVRDNCGAMSPSDTALITIEEGSGGDDPVGLRWLLADLVSDLFGIDMLPEDPCEDNQAPAADAGDDLSGEVEQELQFAGSGSYDADGEIVSWHWDFGDDQSYDGQGAVVVVSHAYAAADTYVATLTVVDDCDDPASDAITVVVDPADPCANNQAPVADAGDDLSGEVEQDLQFDGSESYDADGEIVSWHWDFGDDQSYDGQGAVVVVSHAYAAADTYVATLTVTDDCNEPATDEITVVVEEAGSPGELHADFMVEQLVYVDPETGEETWDVVVLDPDDPIEKGLRVRLNASLSSGAAWFFWDFGDGTYGSDPNELHAFDHDRNVTLTVYTADWSEWDICTKTVYVDGAMQRLSMMPYPGESFCPVREAVLDNEVWALTSDGHVGAADISNPGDLPAIDIMACAPLSGANGIAAAAGKLFVSRGDSGVDVFLASRTAFAPLGTISSVELGGGYACSVAACENVLYVSAGDMYLFDVTGDSPSFITTVDVQGGAGDLRLAGADRLVALNDELIISVYDVSLAAQPVLLEAAVQLPYPYVTSTELSTESVAMRADDCTAILRFTDLGLSPVPFQEISQQASRFVVSEDRYYLFDSPNGRVYKHNIVDVNSPAYLMEEVAPGTTSMNGGFLYDPDGPGPANEVLMVRFPQGYIACGHPQ
jgi:PKD repeat protein